MARYEHLPIYKKALDVAVHFDKVVAGRWVFTFDEYRCCARSPIRRSTDTPHDRRMGGGTLPIVRRAVSLMGIAVLHPSYETVLY